ncbi:hypothetical protein TorRG33x02_044620, partial [Trema orientale]
ESKKEKRKNKISSEREKNIIRLLTKKSYFPFSTKKKERKKGKRKSLFRIPYDALKNNDLNHETLSEITIHGLEQRNSHNQSIRQSSNREDSNEPIQTPTSSLKNDPNREQNDDKNLRESVGQYELGVHLVRVVHGDEVKRQHRNRKHRHEAVDPRTLFRREYLPPLHRTVGDNHCEV